MGNDLTMSLESSLSVALELYEVLQKINAELQVINATVGASTTKDATAILNKHAITTWELFFISRRLLANMKRMGLGDDADKWLTMIQKMITMMRLMTLTAKYMEMSTSVGWAMAAVTGMSALFSFGELAGSYG